MGGEGVSGVPAAAARLGRLTGARVRTSLASTAEVAGLASVGLVPVSEVMGAAGQRIGWLGGGGGWPSTQYRPRTVVAGQAGSPGSGFRPYVEAMHRGYRAVLSRLTAEAEATGADGVVGVRLSLTVRDSGFYEFVGAGTAVRARSPRRPRRPFLTVLSGEDVAKLMRYGWVPVTIGVGISVAVRVGEDPVLAAQSSPFGNYEVTGYSDMIRRAGRDARQRLDAQIQACGADGALVPEPFTRLHHLGPDGPLVAEARLIGTIVAAFAATAPTRLEGLGVLPLRGSLGRGE